MKNAYLDLGTGRLHVEVKIDYGSYSYKSILAKGIPANEPIYYPSGGLMLGFLTAHLKDLLTERLVMRLGEIDIHTGEKLFVSFGRQVVAFQMTGMEKKIGGTHLYSFTLQSIYRHEQQ
jgi:hypothetical protein